MRRTFALLLAVGAIQGQAHAQKMDFHGNGFRPFVGIGFTSGGETILPVTVTEKGGSTTYKEDISSGGGLDLRLGGAYRFQGLPWSVIANWGIHNDQSNGVDGERYSFRRYPVEAQLQYHVTPRGSVGFGLRKATRPVLSIVNGSSGDQTLSINQRETFKASTGVFLEGEWAITSNWGLKARYVHEKFTWTDSDTGDKYTYKADHLGVLTVFYFD